jgi:acyl-homoserine lactone acylase PvdQ
VLVLTRTAQRNVSNPWLNASGVSFPGAPFIGIGFNDYLEWTHTVNVIKNADLYELTLVDGGPWSDCRQETRQSTGIAGSGF